MQLFLASNSPRRRQLIALGGWDFQLVSVNVDESPRAAELPSAYVLRLAEGKARAAASVVPPGSLVLAADTTVVDGGELLGKPADEQEAERMLRRLKGRSHQVYTALAVLRLADGRLETELCLTDVPMRVYSDDEMWAYIQSGDPLDKAGAYAIQHAGFNPVEGLRGCYANVVGLPLCHLTRCLLRLDLAPRADVPAACQAAFEYQCPIYRQVLRGEN